MVPMSSTPRPDEDFTDRVRREWAETYPEVDTSPIEVIGRITRIGSRALQQLDHSLDEHGVSRPEFDVLCVLARSGRPLRASEVTAVTMLSGASTTKHVDRLGRLGLVERLPFERDGRVVLLHLTDAGRALVDAEFPRRIERDRRLLDGLDQDECSLLADLLRRIAANVESGTHP
ncbi:MarR family transcriptional regulator [Rhodococcus sp. FXJ9.536]|uniref:MarR family transcriptional regulator n=2 Tax=Rhodococcus tibetensis TaxID=2965064 RepID=A0ABT1QG00_9NOCA|nr:MarR family transcriptional regulator [Rhodococcus sp. FXJ9.536]MCQ4121208.1 MarR family transcriptional regulator [Rhodococcus sp. FXJ9.536]